MQTPNRLRELRKRKKLTLRQASEMLGISYSTLSKYESGEREPGIETMKKLSEFYGRTPQYIFF